MLRLVEKLISSLLILLWDVIGQVYITVLMLTKDTLGEQIAIHYMEDIMSTMIENDADGNPPVITSANSMDTTYRSDLPYV